MRLILIDKNVMINPEMIEAIEYSQLRNKKVLNIYVNGRRFTSSMKPDELFKELKADGIDLTKQFWAG